jgi:YYY domain-containing protein
MTISPESIQEVAAIEVKSHKKNHDLAWDILLLITLVIGAYFRFTGLNWDANEHLHPDERFLTMVASSIAPLENPQDYFNTEKSTLNPNNRGYGFYVYGTLPLFIVRGVADMVKQTGYDEIFLVGRALSGFFDLLTVYLVYLIVMRLYKKPPMALVAAVLTAGSVMQIQLSHYFAVDTFTTFFVTGAAFFAVRILTRKDKPVMPEWLETLENEDDVEPGFWKKEVSRLLRDWDGIADILLFGFFTGCAMASKINSGLVAAMIPVAYLIRYVKLPKDQRESAQLIFIRNVAVAAFICILTFRVFQPYAFTGPGFFGMGISQKWVETMREISAQSTGDVDFPPALQWARRPIWFAPENMILFGMGLPFGLAAFGGFLLMGWRIFTANWKKHVLLWGWTGVFFAWQASSWVRAMRYQVLIYPMFAIIGAWGIFAIWEKGKIVSRSRRSTLLKTVAVIAGIAAVAGTLAYAFAFTRIYNRTMTRLEASEWIYQNIPGAVNLSIDTGNETKIHPLAFRGSRTISSEDPMDISFTATSSGSLAILKVPHLIDPSNQPQSKTLLVKVSDADGNLLTSGQLTSDYPASNDPRGPNYSISLDIPCLLEKGKNYNLQLSMTDTDLTLQETGPLSLGLLNGEKTSEILLPEKVDGVNRNRPYVLPFSPSFSGKVTEISLPRVVNMGADGGQKKLTVTLSSTPGGEKIMFSKDLVMDFDKSGASQSVTIALPAPVEVKKDQSYSLILSSSDDSNLAPLGNKIALESSWDDPLPLGLNGITPFDYTSGAYRTDLNFEMYWDDNADKLVRFEQIIQQADYIAMTSNRQWGTTPRVPERYPLTSAYYRNLLGCPVEKDVVDCYRVAEAGMFKGNLGFELVKVFQSDPNIGNFKINTQFAEEAFSVYDHPKVMIFKKTSDFDYEKVAKILGAVDLTNVVHLTPHKAADYQGNLTLPADRLASQQAGGTWIELFNPDSVLNKYPWVGAVVWYLVICLLGWLAFPIVRIATKGLSDRGYGISRIIGLALLAYFSWLAGSIGIEYSRLTILVVLLILAAVSVTLFLFQKKEIQADLGDLKRLFLATEIISLILFLMFLGIRLGNPDLWHPYKGGEKPMDFSYFNAILKSTSFPPYDPWFAGGYINYYYYGFVIVGTPVKLLGITPSVAYNLILPTLFSLVGTAAFAIGYSLIDSLRHPQLQAMSSAIRRKVLRTKMASEDPAVVLPSDMEDDEYVSDHVESVLPVQEPAIVDTATEPEHKGINPAAMLGGIGSTLLLLILGNLGTIRMIWHGLIRIGSPTGTMENTTFFERVVWTAEGLVKMFNGAQFPYPVGDWYWIPSRTIPGEPITEFPFFTFLYADMHAHMIALPLTLAVLAWTLSIILRNGQWKAEGERLHAWLQFTVTLFIGSLLVGALKPTNTWDFPTYMLLASVGLIFAALSFNGLQLWPEGRLKMWQMRGLEALISVALFIGLSFVLYQPFTHWYGQGYNSIDIWQGERTPGWSYFTHWGLFITLILSWFLQETYDWLATTPVSSLNKLKPYRQHLILIAALAILIPIALVVYGVGIAWMAFPLAAWALALIFRPGQAPAKRFILFLIGSGFMLTLVVELIVLVGDIGRMNTVFKFYLQAWTMLSLSGAFAFIMVFPRRSEWPGWLNNTWQVVVSILIFCTALFPLLAGTDKIRDRISATAPHTLDGAAYMATSVFNDNGVIIDLNQDYEGIQWMQKNIKDSPLIVEANTVEYRWGSRYTIYTGLPGVVGWNWHQRQQRAAVPSTIVTDRVDEIKKFYETTDLDQAKAFIAKYNVSYMVVGQLENLYYPGPGLLKFLENSGKLWDPVFQNDTTTIYQVRKEAIQ